MNSASVLVVGVGPAGLASARALLDREVQFDHVEANEGVGGLWDIDAPETPTYESAHFISSRTQSGFPGLPLPEDYPDYPSHRQILAYLRSFADRYDLVGRISFRTRVESVVAEPGGEGWSVALTLPDGSAEQRHYRDVVLCTGPMHTPNRPELPGSFSGEVMHSIDYRDPSVFRGRRVLVVGAGNSGCDIVCDAGRTADRAVLSMRRGYWFLPKHLFGRPIDTIDQTGPSMPRWLEQKILSVWLRLTEGDPRRLGLQKPDHKLFETHPIVNSMLLHPLRHGDVVAKPGIADAEGTTVTFTDGSSEEIDLILLCTGYLHTIPVAGDLIPWTILPDHYLATFSREHDGLAAVGFFETNTGAYGHFDSCARMVTGHIADRNGNPEAYRRFAARLHDRPDLSGGIRFDPSDRHVGYMDSHAFSKILASTIAEFGWGAPAASVR